MQTSYRVVFSDAAKMAEIPSESVHLVVTSPPYPLIAMWDGLFSDRDPAIKAALAKGDGGRAFELMHRMLDVVWNEVHRVLRPGGFACINVGDAARTLGGGFALYPNHARILGRLSSLGFSVLPEILWRKQTNAPNKFMGSGMLPAGAYVTLEHEYILVVRKGAGRKFKTPAEKKNRRASAIFWEERNTFYSDIWFDVKGTGQQLNRREARLRSGAFPFEIAYRLICMYSVKGDTVLDPFVGTGTTILAAVAAERNGLGYEIEAALRDTIGRQIEAAAIFSNRYIHGRLLRHMDFVIRRLRERGPFKYTNRFYRFPVMTAQEQELVLREVAAVARCDDTFQVTYSDAVQEKFERDWR